MKTYKQAPVPVLGSRLIPTLRLAAIRWPLVCFLPCLGWYYPAGHLRL